LAALYAGMITTVFSPLFCDIEVRSLTHFLSHKKAQKEQNKIFCFVLFVPFVAEPGGVATGGSGPIEPNG
jgi:hypothetical protein